MKEKKSAKKNTLKDLKNLKKNLPSQQSKVLKPTSESSPSFVPEDNPLLFEKEMERLGVISHKARTGTDLSQELPTEETVLNDKPETRANQNRTDEELFLSSLKNFDTIFEEEDYAPPPEESSSQRTKMLRKKKFVPEKQIDLHGLTRKEALQKVHFFLENASYEGLKTVLIITGCGHGSEGEAVLRGAVEDFLQKEARQWVASWERAPRKLGGEGAVAVFLRSKPG